MTASGLAAVHAAADSVSRADHDAATLAARAEGHASGLAAGRIEGVATERTRIAAIMDGEHAGGREALARHFAFATDMPAEAAAAALQAAPKAAAPPPAKVPRLDGNVPQPNVSAAATTVPDVAARWDAVVTKLNQESKSAHPGRPS